MRPKAKKVKLRDDELRKSIGLEDIMEDVALLANIFIGNYAPEEFTDKDGYRPFTLVMSEYDAEPSKVLLMEEAISKIKNIEKILLGLRVKIGKNNKKALYLYK